MTRTIVFGLCLALTLPLAAWAQEAPPAPNTPGLEIPEVVVEGNDVPLPENELPPIKPSDPKLETEFAPPPVGASVSEQELGKLQFKTDANLFPSSPLPLRDSRTQVRAAIGGLNLYSGGFWDSRQYGDIHSFWQGDWTAGTALLAPWNRQTLSGGVGGRIGNWRLSFGGDFDRTQRQNSDNAGQTWGQGRISMAHPFADGTMTYRANWESGGLSAGGSDAQAHGGDLAVRLEPRWGDHQPLLEAGGGVHWAQANTWPVANLLVADRFQLGPANLEAGLRYQLVGLDHSVAPAVRVGWRGWPETHLSFGLDGGQRVPFAGNQWRTRPFAQIADDLRSEHTYAKASMGLERRLVPGLVLGLGAEAAGVDRRLYWSQLNQGPYWQLRNAPGPMLVWGGNAALRYELGPVTPFVRYQLQQATANDPQFPTDGNQDLRAGIQLNMGPVRAEASGHLLAWSLSAASSGQSAGVQPNMILMDGSLAYDITDSVQLKLTVTDWLLRSNDVLPGFWEPAFTALGGIGAQF